MQFKLTFPTILVAVLLSAGSVFAAPAPKNGAEARSLTKRALVCKPTDDDGSALTKADAANGRCIYASSGVCDYFPANGTFSAGASNCPQSLVEGVEAPPPVTTTRAPPPPQTTTTRAPPPPVTTTTRAPPPPPVTTTSTPPPPPITTTSEIPPPPPPATSTTESISSSTEIIPSTTEVIPTTTSILPPLPPVTTDTPFESFTTTVIVVTATPEPTDLTGSVGNNNGALSQARFGASGLGMVVAVVVMVLSGCGI